MPTEVSDSLLAKIAKLLALSKDKSNEHEAAQAAALAQKLLHEHNLSLAQVERRAGRPKGEVGQKRQAQPIKPGSGSTWRLRLAAHIASSNFCKVLHIKEGNLLTLIWIGRDADVQVGIYIYEYLQRELERLAQEYSVSQWEAAKLEAVDEGMSFHAYEKVLRCQNRHPLLAKRSWLEGAVAGVASTLTKEQQLRLTESTSTALVAVRDQEIAQFVQKTYGKLGRGRGVSSRMDQNSYGTGFSKGRTMQARPGLGSGSSGGKTS